MAERSQCDLSHYSLHALDIGRLLGLARIPIIAGDSMSMNSDFTFRLSQLKRPLALDPTADVFAFYVPYRYTYGQQWINYIEAGTEEGTTFPLVGTKEQPALCCNLTTYPKHIWQDYARIWNNFFRDPAQAELGLDTPQESDAVRKYGLLCNHMKSWGTAQARLADLGHAHYNLPAGTVDIFDIQHALGKGRNKSYRDFIASRYSEIMQGLSGSSLNENIDNRPELVWRESVKFSGFDINGTAGADLGKSVGKGICTVNFNMPRRFFPEHGTLYIFALVRFPPVFTQTVHYLDQFNRAFRHVVPMDDIPMPPVELRMSDLFQGGSSESAGYIPSYEWYRCHPNFVQDHMHEWDRNWQYLDRPATTDAAVRVGNYNNAFATMHFRHCIVQCDHRIDAWRPIPSGYSSIMTEL